MNRPGHDTLFLSLSTWKEKLNEVPYKGGDKGIFFTWFEPVHEKKPEPKKSIQPPPGLARHNTPPSQIDANPHHQTEPSKLEAPAPPSVFEVLRRADHVPSPVFGDNGFSHSPVSSHRLSMKGTSATLDSTHTSSPASSTANINMYADGEYAGMARQPQVPFHQGMNYPLPAALARGLSSASGSSPLVGYSSPIASYSAGAGDMGMQPPFSHSGIFSNTGMRKPSYEQYPMPNPSWQGNIPGHGHGHRGSNLISGGTGVATTSSTTSSLSNVPRAHFGGRRSPSPAPGFSNGNPAGGLTSTLGGEVYDVTLGGPAFHTAIGRTVTGYSPQQQFGTLYRSPVPPIPEMGHGIETGVGIGSAIDQPSTNELYPQGHVTMSIDPYTGLPRRPSVEPMSESWSELQQQSLQQQQEQRAQLQHTEVEHSLSETRPQTEGEIQLPKEEKEKQKAPSAISEAVKAKPSAEVALATPKEEEDVNSQPFIPVKKQQRVPPVQTAEPSHAPPTSVGISPSVSTPTISQSSSKITVPLASLITNPSPAVTTPTAGPPAKAWATVVVKDEAKGLKEIQEAEARRAKENEKLKARAAPSAPIISPGGASSTKDEELGTLLTWGLPTSLAGARAGKDTAAASNASTPPAAVWTGAKVVGGTASNAAKKTTMKDIQEEEEKRKKKEREVVTAAKRVTEKVGYF